ncbi:MAG TPA: FKBP-type peptidyl-prolyl cis-trans isomerase, partial [Solirubrobacterales bacterium]|nr:FKBP-type peptidyl-prolyl cis-trans isomerase [Solirubrobacterales bacterium]
VTVQYVGYDYKTGKKFASSWDNGRPVTFTLGAGEVVPAWEQALDGMEVSDRRVVVAPPKLANGSYPPNVPKGKTVVFILELLPSSSEAKAEAASTAKPLREVGKLKKPKVVPPKSPPPKELVVKDLKPGTGPTAQAGDEVVFHYVEVDYKTGKEYDSSWDRGRPFSFTLGSHQLILAWEEGLEGMRVGGRRELIAPPEWAFEPGGVGNVPPNRTLIFVVDLLAAREPRS